MLAQVVANGLLGWRRRSACSFRRQPTIDEYLGGGVFLDTAFGTRGTRG